MTYETIATFIGIAIGWIILTYKNNAESAGSPIDLNKRDRRALKVAPLAVGDPGLRQSIEAVYTTARTSERLLDRLDAMELSIILHKEENEKREDQINEKFKTMAEKIKYLTDENVAKTRKIIRLQKEVLALKRLLKTNGLHITTDQLEQLVAELPDQDPLEENDKPKL